MFCAGSICRVECLPRSWRSAQRASLLQGWDSWKFIKENQNILHKFADHSSQYFISCVKPCSHTVKKPDSKLQGPSRARAVASWQWDKLQHSAVAEMAKEPWEASSPSEREIGAGTEELIPWGAIKPRAGSSSFLHFLTKVMGRTMWQIIMGESSPLTCRVHTLIMGAFWYVAC